MNEITHVFFFSFAHSQGRLILQPDVLSYIASLWRENSYKIDFSGQDEMKQVIRKFQIPYGHRQVDSAETEAQFAFWWETMWDIFRFHKLDLETPNFPAPTEQILQARSKRYSGDEAYNTSKYSSLKADKMINIAMRIALNTPNMGSQRILTEHLLPNIISVETYFQGFPKYDQAPGRHRVNGTNNFESKLRLHCTKALGKLASCQELDPYDQMYLQISKFLDKLTESSKITDLENTTLMSYQKLILLYNQNNPNEQVLSLHK
jgi:hypothetical protein